MIMKMKTGLLRLPIFLLVFICTVLLISCNNEDKSEDDLGPQNEVTGIYMGTFNHDLLGPINKKLVLKGNMTATFYETIMGSTDTYEGTYTFNDNQVTHSFITDAGMGTTIYTRIGDDLDEPGVCLMEKQ
jgi:hypothetical protein